MAAGTTTKEVLPKSETRHLRRVLAPDLPAAGRRQRHESAYSEWTARPAPWTTSTSLRHGSSARRVPLPGRRWVDRDPGAGSGSTKIPTTETLQARLGPASLGNMSRSHLCELVHGLGRAGPPSGLRRAVRSWSSIEKELSGWRDACRLAYVCASTPRRPPKVS